MKKKVIFSGIQPSGALLISHYIGAIKQWVSLQKKYDCFYSIVDLHAITVEQNPKQLHQNVYSCLALYLACGIDPEQSTLFVQSQVSTHAQLMWILNCYASMGELNRMTQFKDKSKQHKHNINVGLFAYPVLQAADILLYNTNLVPVGADQKQHIELCRDIAGRFNKKYGNIFTIPEPYIPSHGAKLMSLQEPTKKMSKSDPNVNSFVALLDNPDIVLKKLKKAVTDSDCKICFDPVQKPGISNLLQIISILTDTSINTVEKQYAAKGYSALKIATADCINTFLQPIQQRYYDLYRDIPYLEQILQKGKEKALEKSEKILTKVKHAIGLIV